ncbi:alpha/beta hydrolase [Methanobacterium alkalithermotolerans]|uniref:Alpha/beta hydrolase n=1 Tax=Methanobacterium alkalithermotolerans TaxID=2731220 RepID=A0A8T8K596_9EURY|nr:prolyl oligopeptidase family serine peptidase [Methanobacterium alkalithermotolerans]QUH23022.1 alpha/beta hydrolase [Methanobacterium alkalithermotolerans]
MNKINYLLVLLIFLITFFATFSNPGWTMGEFTVYNSEVVLFNDSSFHFEFIRIVGQSAYGTSSVQECLEAASDIKSGDTESWYSAWHQLALKTEKKANSSLSQGKNNKAREEYLMAGNYYRVSEFYLHGNPEDPRIIASWNKSHECFQIAAGLSKPEIEAVEIPYENTTLPAYFYKVDESGKSRPTLIIQTGFDGTQEELYVYAVAANQRGYNVLTFEGPGQGRVIRVQGLPFRPDWEKVAQPVVSYALSRSEVDPEKLAFYGLSFGGYMAPRAAAHDPRIKAVIANGGVYDPVRGMAHNLNITREELMEYIENNPEEINAEIESRMENSTLMAWFFENGMYTFKADSPADFLVKYSECNMIDSADKIKSPALICDSENDLSMKGQAPMLYHQLKCPKTFLLFKTAEGAGDHCQVGNLPLSNKKILDWLDLTFQRTPY